MRCYFANRVLTFILKIVILFKELCWYYGISRDQQVMEYSVEESQSQWDKTLAV